MPVFFSKNEEGRLQSTYQCSVLANNYLYELYYVDRLYIYEGDVHIDHNAYIY
jgi:hypothetical protein